MFNSNKSEAVRPTEICNMASFKLLMVGIFYLSCNWNASFLCNIHLDNPEARVTNNPSDRITKESLKPVVTSKLLKFRNIFTKKSSSKLKSPYLFDVQIASISASYIKFYSLKQFSWNHCKQVGHFSHFGFWCASFFIFLLLFFSVFMSMSFISFNSLLASPLSLPSLVLLIFDHKLIILHKIIWYCIIRFL